MVSPGGATRVSHLYEVSFSRCIQHKRAAKVNLQRSPAHTLVLYNRNLPQPEDDSRCGRRNGRSCSSALSFAAHHGLIQSRAPDQSKLFQMDERARQPLRMAKGIQRFQRERIGARQRGQLHTHPGEAPQR